MGCDYCESAGLVCEQTELEKVVKNFLEKVEEARYEVEKVLEEINTRRGWGKNV